MVENKNCILSLRPAEKQFQWVHYEDKQAREGESIAKEWWDEVSELRI